MGDENYQEAVVLHQCGMFNEALTLLNSAKERYQQEGNAKGVEKALGKLYAVLLALKRYDEAILVSEELCSIAKHTKNPLPLISAMFCRAKAFKLAGKLNEALTTLQEILQQSIDLNQTIMVANSNRELGDILSELERTTEAQHHYDQASKQYEEIDDYESQVHCMLRLGEISIEQKNLMDAEVFYQKSIEISTMKSSKVLYASAAHGLGKTYLLLDKQEQAKEYLEKALTLAKEINSLQMAEQIRNNLNTLS